MSAQDQGQSPDAAAAQREQILEAAVLVVGEGGIHHLTLRDVARRAGVSRRTVRLHFADRNQLVAEIGTLVVLPILDHMVELERNPVEPDERLARYLLFSGEVLILTPVPVAEIIAGPEVHTKAYKPMWDVFGDLTATLVRWLGEATDTPSDETEERMMLAATSLLGWLLYEPDLAIERLPTIVRIQLEFFGVEPERAEHLVEVARTEVL